MASRESTTERKPTALRQVEIVEAAMGILASEGSRKLTAERIARVLGISNGAIFRHFPTMQAISAAIVDRMEEILFSGLPPQAGDPLSRLGLFFEGRVEVIRRNPSVSRILLHDNLIQTDDPALKRRIAGFKLRSREIVRKCLREARRSGVLNDSIRPEEGAILVLGAIYALAHSATRIGPGRGKNGTRGRIWDLLENILRKHE